MVVAIPALISGKLLCCVGYTWALGTKYLLAYVCNLHMEVRGQENISYDQPFIIASKHQSALETIMFWLLIKKPIYILKYELLYLPIYGIYLYKMGMIFVKRSEGGNALRKMLKDIKVATNNGGSLIIFPEGTRVAPGSHVGYKPGIAAMYTNNNLKVVPVALNTGLYWPRNSFMKKPGKYIIQFLPPIMPGMFKKDFMDKLESEIESTSNLLYTEGVQSI